MEDTVPSSSPALTTQKPQAGPSAGLLDRQTKWGDGEGTGWPSAGESSVSLLGVLEAHSVATWLKTMIPGAKHWDPQQAGWNPRATLSLTPPCTNGETEAREGMPQEVCPSSS